MTNLRHERARMRWELKQFEKMSNIRKYPWVLKTPRAIFNCKTREYDSFDFENPHIYYFETREEAEANERIDFGMTGYHGKIENRGEGETKK